MHASRGLIALLVATVLVAALWMVALKPGGSSGGSPAQGVSGYKAAVNSAHQTVQNSVAAAARVAGADPGSATGAPAAAPAPAASTAAAAGATHAAVPTSRTAKTVHPRARHAAAHAAPHATAADRLGTVQRALRAHHVVAMLFYNPGGADDRAVKQELASVPTRRGKVVKLTIPLTEIANYTAVTQQVPVNFSPTLVLVAGNGQADEIVGFSDQFEIAQRVDQALALR